MYNPSKVLIFTALLSAVFFACRPEPDIPPAPAPWQLTDPNPGVRQLTAIEDRLFVQTHTSLYTLDAGGAQTPCLTFDSVFFRIPITKNIVVIRSDNGGQYIDFYPTKNLCGGAAGKRVNLSDMGFPMYTPMAGFNYTPMVATDNGQFLICYATGIEFGLFLFTVDFTDAGQTIIDTVRVQKIAVPNAENFPYLHVVGGKMFASYRELVGFAEYTIIVEPDGSFHTVLPSLMYDIFPLGDTLYTVGSDIFKSADQGNTWEFVSGKYQRAEWPLSLVNLEYKIIYGKLIAHQTYSDPRFFVIEQEIDPKFGRYWELDVSGIGELYYRVESLAEYGDRVYVMTTTGIYSRPLAEFFTAKER